MQLIKTEYVYPDRRKKKPDKLIMVFKNEDGTKIRKRISEPKITYYITLDDYLDNDEDEDIPRYISKEKVRKVTTPFKDLFNSITEELDDPKVTALYRSAFDTQNIRETLNKIHLDKRLHGTDISIEDYYIDKFLRQNDYEENMYGISKIAFDIEVDTSEHKGFPDPSLAECPINAISMKDINNKVINGYFLNYDGVESFDKFKKKIKSFKQSIYEKYNKEYEINLYFFDDEIELICSFFDYINEIKPDFAFCWNMDFDFPYIVNRLTVLGYAPSEIMCPEDIPPSERNVSYKLDTKNDLSDKHSTFTVAGYTNYLDEMALYANITKPLGKEESYNLDYIASKVCGIHKEEVEGGMKFFHLINYEQFIAYSLQDSYALGKIDETTSHIDLYYTVSLITRTKIENAMKKTVCLKNMARYYAYNRGEIQSNNRAKLYEKPEGKIPGAFVGEVTLIDFVGYLVNGTFSNVIFENVADLDLSALYPSIVRALNTTVDTLLGSIEYDGNGFTGVDFLTDYISHDVVNISNRYFNLPAFEEIEQLIQND